tara:strand:- start:570 stop:2300 length:1731 start_codon:yes stop_codon:yes gene_type:complete
MNLRIFLEEKAAKCLSEIGVDGSALVKQSSRPEHGHYQANGVMGAAKKTGRNPRQLASDLASLLQEKNDPNNFELEVAGPGFINFTLSGEFLSKTLHDLEKDPRLGVSLDKKRKILADYSSPNLAKEMHIGHLRSTTIGDACSRILEFLGHEVVRVNHVGDWGSQFGSLLAYMDKLSEAESNLGSELKDLELFYKKATELFKEDENFAKSAREYVVKLQSEDPQCMKLWSQFIAESLDHCQNVYERLGVALKKENTVAESFYNNQLNAVITDLENAGLITISDGAKCVFLDAEKGRDGEPTPAIVQKSDGGFPYIATDLAATKYRSKALQVDDALYFVDARQALHFKDLFKIAKRAGFIDGNQNFVHIANGIILNKEGKPYKTREGGAVKLAEVIDESISRAKLIVSEKASEMPDEEQKRISELVGIGSIKYAELSKNRTTDYVFDWDQMLSFDGNTAPYLMYAYTRIRGIINNSGVPSDKNKNRFNLTDRSEVKLALKLVQFTESVEAVVEDYNPNLLCNYLFELAQIFMAFYEHCPVNSSEQATKESRIHLCDLTGRVLKKGLELLGIEVLERM